MFIDVSNGWRKLNRGERLSFRPKRPPVSNQRFPTVSPRPLATLAYPWYNWPVKETKWSVSETMRTKTRPRGRPKSGGGPPAWLVFIVGVALVFGFYYLWQGVQNFFRTGGRGVIEATEQAVVVSTATAERVTSLEVDAAITPPPTRTPVPECQEFVVSVPNAIIRDAPSSNGAILGSANEGEKICVLGMEPDTDWYVIDQTPGTRRLNLAYMHVSVIRAVNPTPTPSRTPSPLPTVTPLPTDTATPTPSPQPTEPSPTPDERQASQLPDVTDTPEPTATTPPPTDTIRQTA